MVENLLQQDLSRQLGLFQGDFLAKICRWVENKKDFQVLDQDYFGKSAESLTKPKRKVSFSKMSVVYYRQTMGEICEQSSMHLMSAGMASGGVVLTLNISQLHNEGNESLLSDFLETGESVPAKYWLSRKAADGILERGARNNQELPLVLQNALLTI